ncbi:8536_t:CDS:2 [Paraglomus brasilianum]|uniref:8536_t:CDS:1 n=1 Tax=Paraglomus brasilianum TaxID=144538 RepID=A0A9N9FGQ1_9GLOM|nr:8536_t:CDS:2 [Paraglomus brasilianum]
MVLPNDVSYYGYKFCADHKWLQESVTRITSAGVWKRSTKNIVPTLFKLSPWR